VQVVVSYKQASLLHDGFYEQAEKPKRTSLIWDSINRHSKRTISSTWHIINFPFLNFQMCRLAFCQLDILSTCHFVALPFVNLPFCQITILSTCHCVGLHFFNFSLCCLHFVNLPFCQLAILSTCHCPFFPFHHFINLPLCQLAHCHYC
jgi:hypothetical protein